MSSLLSSSRMCSSIPIVSQTSKLRVNGTNRFPIAMTMTATRNYNVLVPSRLYKPLQSISVGRRHTCILYAQLSSASKSRFTLPTSAKVATSKSSSSSAAAATKLQERQRLKWKIIARVAYYLRVSCYILYIVFFSWSGCYLYATYLCTN